MAKSPTSYEERLRKRLTGTESSRSFQTAFRRATGLPLHLASASDPACIVSEQPNQNPFCAVNHRLAAATQHAKRTPGTHQLRNVCLATPMIDTPRYRAMVAMLGHFSSQLTAHAEELAITQENKETAAVHPRTLG